MVAKPKNVCRKLHVLSSFTLQCLLDACVRSRVPHPLHRICAFARRDICGHIAPHLLLIEPCVPLQGMPQNSSSPGMSALAEQGNADSEVGHGGMAAG